MLASRAAPPGSREEAATGPGQACSEPAGEAIEAFDFPEASHALEGASVAIVGQGPASRWVLSGMEIDVASDTERQGRTSRIIQDGVVIPSPAADSARVETPVAVSLPGGGWGLLWAEAEAGPYSGKPPFFMLRRLWFAERAGPAWSRPRLLLESPLGLSWETGRTLRYSPAREPYVMVLVSGFGGRDRIVFGSLVSGLEPVPLDSAFAPRLATFVIDRSGSITVAAIAEADGAHQILLLTSTDGRWSTPNVVASVSGEPQRLRMHVDGEQSLHLLWSTASSDSLDHMLRLSGRSGWIHRALGAPEGVLLRWASGLDRCRRLTVIQEVMESATEVHLVSSHWDARRERWSRPENAFPGFFAFHLFDGAAPDGAWYVGWGGNRDEAGKGESLDLKVWLARP